MSTITARTTQLSHPSINPDTRTVYACSGIAVKGDTEDRGGRGTSYEEQYLAKRERHLLSPSTRMERYPRIERVAGRLFEGEEAVLHVMG
jgi:hypothetical protein